MKNTTDITSGLRETFSQFLHDKHKLSVKQASRHLAKHTKSARESIEFIGLLAAVGDERAYRELVQIALKATYEIDSLTFSEPEAAKQIAKGLSGWPVVASLHPDSHKRVTWRLCQLGLGSETIYRPLKKKPWSQKTLANAIILARLQTMRLHRASNPPPPAPSVTLAAILALPRLTPKTANRWFGVMWKNICANHAGHPEDDKNLRSLGVHRIGGEGKWTEVQQRDTRKFVKPEPALVRNAIRAALFSAFKTIIRTELVEKKKK